MEILDLFEKNKNKILNFGVLAVAFFIAWQIWQGADQKVAVLNQQKADELNKNTAMVEIAGFEKKIDGYKKIFTKKDVGSVMDTISSIAKNCLVKIVSIKPGEEKVYSDYIKSSFMVSISAPGYHALGNFISQIENFKDIYIVDEVNVTSNTNQAVENLNVNLKISTISYK
ncbi:MAG: type 4a pilus biogenesis protein PilO [Candidatus Omnitrophota bacterium]